MSILFGIISALCWIAVVILAILGIWSGDERWGMTALVFGAAGVVTFAASAIANDAGW